MRVLLIEDEQHVSSFIKRGLEEHGFRVTQAFDGSVGLKLASQDDFSIIILDVIMPGMNGIEVCSKLKNELYIDTPIIMLTALSIAVANLKVSLYFKSLPAMPQELYDSREG